MGGARRKEPRLVREVTVDRHPLDTRTTRDFADLRRSRANGAMQLNGRLGDPQPSLLHLLGALLQLVLSPATHSLYAMLNEFDIFQPCRHYH